MPIKIIIHLLWLLLFKILRVHSFDNIGNISVSTLEAFDQIRWREVLENEDAVQDMLKKLSTTMATTTVKQHKYAKSVQFLNMVVNGSADELRAAAYKKVVQAIRSLGKMNLSWQKKLIIWEIFKNRRCVRKMDRNDLEVIGDLILYIPENDLYKINVMNWEILDFLGRLSEMNHRKAAILAYSIKHKIHDVLLHAYYINRIKGLLCGFPSRDLSGIKTEVIVKVDSQVFRNLWACTLEQINVLLKQCMSTFLYGHIETWTGKTLEHLGFLILGLSPSQIQMIEPSVVSTLDKIVMRRFNVRQVRALTSAQVQNLNGQSRAVYNYKILVGNSSRKTCNCVVYYYIAAVWIILQYT